MALAAINSHKRAVNGRDTLGPGEVCLFVEERLGCRVDPCNWARDYAATWERLARHVDKLDAQALRPVAEVVAKQSGLRKGPGWRWLQEDRDIVAEQRAELYSRHREQMQERLAERLRSMSNQQLAAWAGRMRRYSDAYRAEWKDDVYEQPDVHQRYHDRVAAYWAQRERLRDVEDAASQVGEAASSARASCEGFTSHSGSGRRSRTAGCFRTGRRNDARG